MYSKPTLNHIEVNRRGRTSSRKSDTSDVMEQLLPIKNEHSEYTPIALAVKDKTFDDYEKERDGEDRRGKKTNPTALLFLAALRNDMRFTVDLIKRGADVNAKHRDFKVFDMPKDVFCRFPVDIKDQNKLKLDVMKPLDVALYNCTMSVEALVANGAKPKTKFFGGYQVPDDSRKVLNILAIKRGMKSYNKARRRALLPVGYPFELPLFFTISYTYFIFSFRLHALMGRRMIIRIECGINGKELRIFNRGKNNEGSLIYRSIKLSAVYCLRRLSL